MSDAREVEAEQSSGAKRKSSSRRPADSVGKYRQVAPICTDSIGKTWLGAVREGPDAGRQVLLTSVGHPPDSLLLRPLLQAARSELQLRHSGVLAFLAIEAAPERVVFVSEAMEGEPLSTVMGLCGQGAGHIPGRVALRIVRDAIESLMQVRAAHRHGVQHGVLNPETIFVASCGEVLLRQPLLRSAALNVQGFRRHPTIAAYRAPEMLLDERESSDCADVFSAGVLLWEMLAGRGLFADENLARLGRGECDSSDQSATIEQRILSHTILPLDRIERHGGVIHPDVVRLVSWTLARDPAERPHSLRALARALDCLPPELMGTAAEVGALTQRLLQDTFARREQLVAQALTPSRPPSQPAPSTFPNPKTVPRRQAIAAMAQGQTPEHFAPESMEHPPAVIPISPLPSAKPAYGWSAVAAGFLFASAAGGYFLLQQGFGSQAASSGDVVIDESRQRSVEPIGNTAGKPNSAGEATADENEESDAPADETQRAESDASPTRGVNSATRSTPSGASKGAPKGAYRPSGI